MPPASLAPGTSGACAPLSRMPPGRRPLRGRGLRRSRPPPDRTRAGGSGRALRAPRSSGVRRAASGDSLRRKEGPPGGGPRVLLDDLEVLVHLRLVHGAVGPPASRLQRPDDGLRRGRRRRRDQLLELRLRRPLPFEREVVEARLVADNDPVLAGLERLDLLAALLQRDRVARPDDALERRRGGTAAEGGARHGERYGHADCEYGCGLPV